MEIVKQWIRDQYHILYSVANDRKRKRDVGRDDERDEKNESGGRGKADVALEPGPSIIQPARRPAIRCMPIRPRSLPRRSTLLTDGRRRWQWHPSRADSRRSKYAPAGSRW